MKKWIGETETQRKTELFRLREKMITAKDISSDEVIVCEVTYHGKLF